MKRCFRCGRPKEIDQFYKHAMMADGHLGKCKDCAKSDVRLHREQSEGPREYDAWRYRHDPIRRAFVLAGSTRRAAADPVKRAARSAVNHAVRDGRLVKPTICPWCGVDGKRIVGHHEDYAKPLDVVWMCFRCHARYHHAIPPNPPPDL